uniref:Uncharacterized protein n=1 Tax=Timspurckia oligopyrenoides TaxID=708627 RepID=A0A7S0ZBC8_9RHOD|mmetsp:Transcript_11216/g.20261  ORF Transcript_11216/g.20261 Transcript_11216/m.20261 type:complete len:471 (+) Transcript_11216:109-1521(+)
MVSNAENMSLREQKGNRGSLASLARSNNSISLKRLPDRGMHSVDAVLPASEYDSEIDEFLDDDELFPSPYSALVDLNPASGLISQSSDEDVTPSKIRKETGSIGPRTPSRTAIQPSTLTSQQPPRQQKLGGRISVSDLSPRTLMNSMSAPVLELGRELSLTDHVDQKDETEDQSETVQTSESTTNADFSGAGLLLGMKAEKDNVAEDKSEEVKPTTPPPADTETVVASSGATVPKESEVEDRIDDFLYKRRGRNAGSDNGVHNRRSGSRMMNMFRSNSGGSSDGARSKSPHSSVASTALRDMKKADRRRKQMMKNLEGKHMTSEFFSGLPPAEIFRDTEQILESMGIAYISSVSHIRAAFIAAPQNLEIRVVFTLRVSRAMMYDGSGPSANGEQKVIRMLSRRPSDTKSEDMVKVELRNASKHKSDDNYWAFMDFYRLFLKRFKLYGSNAIAGSVPEPTIRRLISSAGVK